MKDFPLSLPDDYIPLNSNVVCLQNFSYMEFRMFFQITYIPYGFAQNYAEFY
jgi:hypothetical protein